MDQPSTHKSLSIEPLVGIDLDKGERVRASNSFQILENFDLVRSGLIRKMRGISLLKDTDIVSPIIAMIDYQSAPAADDMVVGIAYSGRWYSLLPTLGYLGIKNPGTPSQPPWLGIVPIDRDGESVQHIICTRESNPVQKVYIDTARVGHASDLGVSNPRDDWATPYQHSIGIPILFGATSTTDAQNGVRLNGHWRYRWTYYDPTTKHDSSPAPVNVGPFKVTRESSLKYTGLPPQGASHVSATPDPNTGADRPYVEQVVMIICGLGIGGILPAPSTGGDAYSKIRIWRTTDEGTTYYLLTRVYGDDGTLLTDDEGAIDRTAIKVCETGEGIIDPNDSTQLDPNTTRLYDGYVAEPTDDWTVSASDLTGNYIDITGGTILSLATAVNTPRYDFPNGMLRTHPDKIMIEGSDKVFTIWQAEPMDRYILQTDVLLSDEFPITGPPVGAKITFVRNKPVSDSELLWNEHWIGDEFSHNPPAPSRWGVVYMQRLWLVNDENPTVLQYSEPGAYEDFPPTNRFIFTDSGYMPIVTLISSQQLGLVSEGVNQRLLVLKAGSIAQVLGTGITADDFLVRPFLPSTGVIAPRAVAVVDGIFLALTVQGLEVLDIPRPLFVGKKVRTILSDVVQVLPPLASPQIIGNSKEGVTVISYSSSSGSGNNAILLMSDVKALLRENLSPFSTYGDLKSGTLPLRFYCMYESTYLGGEQPIILAAGTDYRIYRLFSPDSGLASVAEPDETHINRQPLIATARTQQLPAEDLSSLKMFHILWVSADDLMGSDGGVDAGWDVRFSVDEGVTFCVRRQLYEKTYIGMIGKSIVIELRHNREVLENEELPSLSMLELEYTIIGRSSHVAT